MKDAFGFGKFPTYADDFPVLSPRPSFRVLCIRFSFAALLGLFGLILWLMVDIAFYARQEVRLDRVGQFCFIKYNAGRRTSRQVTNPTPDCEGLARQMRQQRLSSSYRLVKDNFIAFTYISPADGKPHIGMFRRSTNDAGQTAKRGDEIVIHASRLFAVTYTDWSSPSVYK
ncbi:MAG: hypothetical protein JWM58_3420 [Rhizobium sp.]|nr:hypothetical protein [Rhizobium sp.]